MAGGLAALLDDVAMIAKAASSASMKAVGVVVDDTTVTPQYLNGFSPARELPVVGKIARGSLVNKAILIVLLLVLDHFLPVVLTPLLMLGGLYLSFEGAEKAIEAFSGHKDKEEAAPVVEQGPVQEKAMVKQAITTDFILSAEIMVISLNTVNDSAEKGLPVGEKAIVLAFVAILITALVYGVVAILVKIDDIGLAMMERESASAQRTGKALVRAMPIIMNILETVGMLAMMWVGGHILVNGANTLGWHTPAEIVHHLAAPAGAVPNIGGALEWLVDTLCSAIVAFVVGSVLVGITHLIHRLRGTKAHDVHTVEA